MKTIEELRKEIQALEATVKNQEEKIARLEKLESWYIEQLKLRQKEKLGKSSEQIDENQITLFDLFNEAEELREAIMPEPTEEVLIPTHKRKKKRGASYKDLPVEVVEYKLDDEDLACGTCENALHVMSKEVRKELKIVPAQISVVEHVTYIYSCRNCENTGTEATIVKADSPKALIPKSLASPSVVSYIMNQKCTMSVPLYRQEQEWKRYDVKLIANPICGCMQHRNTQRVR